MGDGRRPDQSGEGSRGGRLGSRPSTGEGVTRSATSTRRAWLSARGAWLLTACGPEPTSGKLAAKALGWTAMTSSATSKASSRTLAERPAERADAGDTAATPSTKHIRNNGANRLARPGRPRRSD